MSEHEQARLTRHCDVAIVGGSAAGLAAALQIQRQHRSVIVIDSCEPRNAPAAHMHGYLGYDGASPGDLTDAGRAELRRYGGELLEGRVTTIDRDDDGFVLDAGNVAVRARRVVAATGVTDELPPIDGIAKHWGTSVLHCPFCHGYEVRGRRLVHVITHAAHLHPARLFAHLSDRLSLVVDPDVEVEASDLAGLADSGVDVIRAGVRRIVERPDSSLAGVELSDGQQLPADAVVVGPRLRPRLEPFVEIGLTAETHPIGVADFVAIDPRGETSVAGLYAAGNVTDPSQQVLAAAASGSHVGAMVAFDLATEDCDAPRRSTSSETEWNARYAGEHMWSGNPNGTLVAEIESVTPGSVLDIGAGEGGDALWLAERGWDVTATDVAHAGLDRLAKQADSLGAAIRCVTADLNGWRPFEDETYDLVTLSYSAIPRTGDDRGIDNILRAVAPGGTLLMVGHAPSSDRGSPDGGHVVPWDRESFVGIDHLEAAIRSDPAWTIATREVRDRPPGSSTHHHHDRDDVLRAHRAASVTNQLRHRS